MRGPEMTDAILVNLSATWKVVQREYDTTCTRQTLHAIPRYPAVALQMPSVGILELVLRRASSVGPPNYTKSWNVCEETQCGWSGLLGRMTT